MQRGAVSATFGRIGGLRVPFSIRVCGKNSGGHPATEPRRGGRAPCAPDTATGREKKKRRGKKRTTREGKAHDFHAREMKAPLGPTVLRNPPDRKSTVYKAQG